jgi:cellobiose-specific phosphotransferase system component IIA
MESIGYFLFPSRLFVHFIDEVSFIGIITNNINTAHETQWSIVPRFVSTTEMTPLLSFLFCHTINILINTFLCKIQKLK